VSRLRDVTPLARVQGVAADVRDEVVLSHALDRAEGAYGPLTTLVCSAGVGVIQTVSATTDEDWREIMDVNLTSVWRASRLALPRLASSGGGSIITIGSDAGLQVERRLGAYSVSKVALVALTKLLALDAASAQVRVNCICPGYIEPGMRDFPNRIDEKQGPEPEPLPPLGRHGQSADVAAAAVYLASDAASFVTGAILAVDGGFTIGIGTGT
jgi:NAD(P)-dependent dehydrogenase (short-subunit alcohol dehydrogenase family)